MYDFHFLNSGRSFPWRGSLCYGKVSHVYSFHLPTREDFLDPHWENMLRFLKGKLTKFEALLRLWLYRFLPPVGHTDPPEILICVPSTL